MAEILTESFCERCGTRYTFEAKPPRKGRVGKVRILSKGLKNYVLSDESTLEEALEEARGDEERQLSSQQLEAFHQTFNFCMSCRQYTCANCWNELEARCLTCAPDLSQEVLPTAFPDLPMVPDFGQPTATDDLFAQAPPTAWPTTDVRIDLVAGAAIVAEPDEGLRAPTDEQPVEEIDEDRLAARLATLGAVAAVVEEAPAAETVETTSPEPSIEEDEAEIAAMLAALATDGVAAEAEPVTAVEPAAVPEPEPEAPIVPIRDAEPLTLADRHGWRTVAPEPSLDEEPVAATAADGNGHAPAPMPPVASPPAAPIAATAGPSPAPQTQAPHPAAAPRPAWPSPTDAPQWPTPVSTPAPVAAGPVARHGTNALWVESTRDVVSRPGSGVSACVSCGLPLSATARFCRRCGGRQN